MATTRSCPSTLRPRRSVELVRDATLKVYPAPARSVRHPQEQLNVDLLAFLEEG
jgi:hypothetical protein